jgi:hypothetical protein
VLKLPWTALRRGDEVLERDDLAVRDASAGAGTALSKRTRSVMQVSPREPDPEQHRS